MNLSFFRLTILIFGFLLFLFAATLFSSTPVKAFNSGCFISIDGPGGPLVNGQNGPWASGPTTTHCNLVNETLSGSCSNPVIDGNNCGGQWCDLTQGTHTVYCFCSGNACGGGDALATFHLDNVPPTVSINCAGGCAATFSSWPTITINGADNVGLSEVDYSFNNTNWIPIANGGAVPAQGPGSYSVYARAIDLAGQLAFAGPVSFSYIPSPTITSFLINGTAPTASVQQGGSITLSWNTANATSCSASANPFNSTWNGGVATAGGATFSTAGYSLGAHNFTLSCIGPGGSTAATVTANITPPPPVIASCSANGTNPTSVIMGQTVNLNTTILSGTATSYHWTDNNGLNSTSASPSLSTAYNLAGTYTATVVASNSAGSSSPCSVSISVASFSVTVTSNPANIAANIPVTFTAIPSVPGSFTYSWQTPASGTAQTSNPVIFTTAGATITVQVQVRQGTSNPVIGSKTFTVSAPGNSACYNQTPRLQGLLSTSNLNTPGKFGNNLGQCVIDPVQAGIVSFKIPSFDQLKNTYFERKTSVNTGPNQIDKTTINSNVGNLDLTGGGNPDRIWDIKGNLTLPDPTSIKIQNSQRAVIFVEGDLNIGNLDTSGSNDATWQNFDAASKTGNGIVYIVKGNVNFGRNVNIFNGIIIDQGTICTSVDGGGVCLPDAHSSSDSGNETRQLIINGNLISLDSTKPIKFQRNLIFALVHFPNGNDATNAAAEIINVQPKYLAIMKDLLSDNYTIQTEDTYYALNQ